MQTLPDGDDRVREATILKIQELLGTKNDTARFVGLTLLEAVLANTPGLQGDQDAIARLWECISPTFLHRLLKTGISGCATAGPRQKDAKNMLDVGVAVIRAFTMLLPEDRRGDAALVDRIPLLVASLLNSSTETADLALEALSMLVNRPEGASVFTSQVDDLSPLTEIATSHPLALDVLSLAWLGNSAAAVASPGDKPFLRQKIDATIGALVSTFKGTDAVTLLNFLSHLLRNLDDELIPLDPTWLRPVVAFIHNLAASRPAMDARAAYTNLSAALLLSYADAARRLLFSSEPLPDSNDSSPKPQSYLLVNLVLIDLRASVPQAMADGLWRQHQQAAGYLAATRLKSAFEVLGSFIAYLTACLGEEEGGPGPTITSIMSPDLLLKLRSAILETMFLTVECLRDWWEGSPCSLSAAGLEQGPLLPPSAGSALEPEASVYELPLAALRTLSFWLREDDGQDLRDEAASALGPMLLSLYTLPSSSPAAAMNFRGPVLMALGAIATTMLKVSEESGGSSSRATWDILTRDLLEILQSMSSLSEAGAERGLDIVGVLLPLVEAAGERAADWMDFLDLLTTCKEVDGHDADLAGSKKPPGPAVELARNEIRVAVLHLAHGLFAAVDPLTAERYAGSARMLVHGSTAMRQSLASQQVMDVELIKMLDKALAALETFAC